MVWPYTDLEVSTILELGSLINYILICFVSSLSIIWIKHDSEISELDKAVNRIGENNTSAQQEILNVAYPDRLYYTVKQQRSVP